jgi:malate/lactate dehydrogenase
MAVPSEGNPYGVADGLIFSFPVITEAGGKWRFADGFTLDEHAKSCIAASQAELEEERVAATT